MFTGDLDKLVKQALDPDKDRKQKHTVVRLPCCGSSIEVIKTQDQFVVCPNKQCRKRHALVWSLKPKIKSEGSENVQRLDW